MIHPTFDKPYTIWEGERVRVDWTPSLRAESFKYLVIYNRVFLADSIRQRGLHNESKIAGKGTHPIAANYTAALAVLYSHAKRVAGSAAGSFLRPDTPRFATGIYMIHPYDPNKVPVLFIHGLISSPISWQNLANDLCLDPKILEHYQPWFFLYPTGQPALESALQLREDLQATQRLFDPKGIAIASHHVVVIAHSMGGLLAHTLVSDTGDALWNVFATKPLNSLSISGSEKDLILKYFFFRHQPAIDRVIFLAVPHRGSRLAVGILGSVGNRRIRHSKSPAQAMKELAAQYPGILNPY